MQEKAIRNVCLPNRTLGAQESMEIQAEKLKTPDVNIVRQFVVKVLLEMCLAICFMRMRDRCIKTAGLSQCKVLIEQSTAGQMSACF